MSFGDLTELCPIGSRPRATAIGSAKPEGQEFDGSDIKSGATKPNINHMSMVSQAILTGYSGFLCLLTIEVLLGVWPDDGNLTEEKNTVRLFIRKITIPREKHLFLVAVLMRLLGASTNSLWWVVAEISKRELDAESLLWYIAKPWIGLSIAVMIYALLRGGLLITGLAGSKEINVYGMAGVIGVAGFFSKEVADKLSAMVKG